MNSAVRSVYQTVRARVSSNPFTYHVSILTISNFVNAALNFVSGILVARWLGPELYGVAALVMSVPSLVYTFFDARSAEASIKFLSEFDVRGERERAVAMCKLGYAVDFAVAGIALLVVLLLSSWAAKNVVHRPEMKWLIILYGSAFLPRALVGTSYAVLATLSRFSTIALIEIVATCLRVGLVLGLVGLGWKVAGVVLGNAIAMATAGFVYGVLAYNLVKSRWGCSWLSGNWHYLKGRRREIFSFLGYNELNALLGMIVSQLDVVLLGYFRNATEVGYYKLAKNIGSSAVWLAKPLQSVIYPRLTQLYAIGDDKRLLSAARQLTLGIGAPLGLGILVLVGLMPFVLPALFGDAYRPAVVVAQLLLISSGTWLVFFWLRPLFFATGKIRWWTTIGATNLALLFPFLVLASWLWGYLGVAGSVFSLNILSVCGALFFIVLKADSKSFRKGEQSEDSDRCYSSEK